MQELVRYFMELMLQLTENEREAELQGEIISSRAERRPWEGQPEYGLTKHRVVKATSMFAINDEWLKLVAGDVAGMANPIPLLPFLSVARTGFEIGRYAAVIRIMIARETATAVTSRMDNGRAAFGKSWLPLLMAALLFQGKARSKGTWAQKNLGNPNRMSIRVPHA